MYLANDPYRLRPAVSRLIDDQAVDANDSGDEVDNRPNEYDLTGSFIDNRPEEEMSRASSSDGDDVSRCPLLPLPTECAFLFLYGVWGSRCDQYAWCLSRMLCAKERT